MRLVKVAVVCSLALSLSSCFFGADVQVFSKKDLSPISKPRLQAILEAYPSIISAEPMSDNTVKISHNRHGKTEECDLGFIYLVEPKGYFILTNMSPNCTLWKSNPQLGSKYNYIVVANVGTERIANRILRDDVARVTPNVIWPEKLTRSPDDEEFRYLLKKYNLQGKRFGEWFSEKMSELRNDPNNEMMLAIVMAFGEPEGDDGKIFVIDNKRDDRLGKDQLLGFFRDAIRYGFFTEGDSPVLNKLSNPRQETSVKDQKQRESTADDRRKEELQILRENSIRACKMQQNACEAACTPLSDFGAWGMRSPREECRRSCGGACN